MGVVSFTPRPLDTPRNIPRYTFIGGGVGPNVGRGPLYIINLKVVIISVAALKDLFVE